MAQKQVAYLIDDIDGSAADHTVRFSLDGLDYEIDLSRSNRNAFLRELARFIAAAEATGGDAPQLHYTSTKADPRAVREWARANGIDVPDGRRLPREVIDRFHAAGN